MDIITIYGPTASGKTAVGVQLAEMLGAVIFSGDSRQVYKGMDIGTGKDLEEYRVDEVSIPYRMIDIAEAGEEYNLHRYMEDFYRAYDELPTETPKILCGGTGLYMTAILGGYQLTNVGENKSLRATLEELSLDDLQRAFVAEGGNLSRVDRDNRRRLIRAIEVARAKNVGYEHHRPLHGPIFCIDISRELRRIRISERLSKRLASGMVDEVKALLKAVPAEQLLRYGLEYKYVTEYALGHLSYDEMYHKLETAIHQFAKRQMTWVRGMERRGFTVNYIQPSGSPRETAERILEMINTDNIQY